MDINKVYLGDSLETIKTFPDEFIDCVVTSPPYYGLRSYNVDGQIGLEDKPEDYIERLVCLFREIRRCLKPGGTIWVNIGDSYAHSGIAGSGGISKVQCGNPGSYFKINKKFDFGCKPKDLVGIPWMLAFALRNDGWFLRQDIIWAKPNPMPESITDRCTRSHEYIFLLSKSDTYYFDGDSIMEEAVSDSGIETDRGGAVDAEQAGCMEHPGKGRKRSPFCHLPGETDYTLHIGRMPQKWGGFRPLYG